MLTEYQSFKKNYYLPRTLFVYYTSIKINLSSVNTKQRQNLDKSQCIYLFSFVKHNCININNNIVETVAKITESSFL